MQLEDKIFRPAEKVSWKEMDGLVIVVNVDTGAYYSLNETASLIWTNIASGKSVAEAHREVLHKYKAEEGKLMEDILACINEWTAEDIIVGA